MIESIAEKTQVPASDIILLVDGQPAQESTKVILYSDAPPIYNSYSKPTTDGLSLNCKDIVLNQQKTGFWSAKVLELTLTKTLEELVALN